MGSCRTIRRAHSGDASAACGGRSCRHGTFEFLRRTLVHGARSLSLGLVMVSARPPQGHQDSPAPLPDFPGTGLLRAANTRNVFQARSTLAPGGQVFARFGISYRSEEHTSELQSLTNLVCRLLLEKKNHTNKRVLTR